MATKINDLDDLGQLKNYFLSIISTLSQDNETISLLTALFDMIENQGMITELRSVLKQAYTDLHQHDTTWNDDTNDDDWKDIDECIMTVKKVQDQALLLLKARRSVLFTERMEKMQEEEAEAARDADSRDTVIA
jgi:hypothetical protein